MASIKQLLETLHSQEGSHCRMTVTYNVQIGSFKNKGHGQKVIDLVSMEKTPLVEYDMTKN